MGLNSNHTAEELNGIRCGIVEKNISAERAQFLTALLSGNGYNVICVPAAPPKAKAAAAPKEGEEAPPVAEEPKPITSYTLGVTDVTFNPINAIFGRLLKTKEGNIVSLAYWNQKEKISEDEIPYFENKNR